jgi:cephalosporin-C deacetylase-like acetyl esterase
MPVARVFASLGALFFLSSSLFAQEIDAEKRLLHWMDRIAQGQLDARAKRIDTVRTVEEAERRKTEVRKKILELIGGLPDYAGPLNARVTGRIEKQKYSIEKVIFESLPRFYVTANLYRPNEPGHYPGVLIPLGHWDAGKVAEQRMAANFAMKGFVALAYDPIGQGERVQAYDRRLGPMHPAWAGEQHLQAGAQSLLVGESFARYRIWDAKRALDYLVSRPEVDAERIGCTGCSGGGALTTYISALDPRIKVAAPACWMSSYRVLFSGPVGDSEQSLPYFLSSGLDQADYVELFAPKPWMIVSTIEDFFPLEGARQIYEEARHWYRLYGAEDRVAWAVGPGEHGTPKPVRERVYEWMIRWLKDGKGDPLEEPVEMAPNHELLATASGQVSVDLASREVYEFIREGFERRRESNNPNVAELLGEVQRLMGPLKEAPPEIRVVEETRETEHITQKLLLETEPGLELHGALLVPRIGERHSGLLVVESGLVPSPLATDAVRRGAVVLSLAPRGLPRSDDRRPFGGDYLMNTRAWLIGKNLAGMRAYDIRRAIDLLAARRDVNDGSIRAVARAEAGIWLLLAAATDQRIRQIWLDKTPHSLQAALDGPQNRNLHMAVIPGFCLKWDLSSLLRAMEGRKVIWTDPTDWLGNVVPLAGDFRYRGFEEEDDRIMDELMR